jgi:hypothetical protein
MTRALDYAAVSNHMVSGSPRKLVSSNELTMYR